MANPFSTGGYGNPLVTNDGSQRSYQVWQLLNQILIELRVQNELLKTGLGVADDVQAYRSDPSYSAPTTLTNAS